MPAKKKRSKKAVFDAATKHVNDMAVEVLDQPAPAPTPVPTPTTPERHRVSKEFIIAGDAVFTIQKPDGTHRTFRVRYSEPNGKWGETWFVSMLTGPDNTKDFTYVGILNDWTGQVRCTAKSPYPADKGPVNLLNRVLARIWADDHATIEQHGYFIHHEGRCGRCGRALTVPESIESGFGPECIKLMNGELPD